ncbi:MAG: DedA family protein [Methylococcaceae bacterium]|nr:DedA family protein [Methylococcaceae bacterium]
MEELIQIIQANIQYAHFIIFGALLLAGLNIPVSEDAMLFIAAILASSHPEYLVQLFFGVYLGAYFSDLICYGLGRKFGPKLFKIKFFASMAPPERVTKISVYYQKYGVMTLILGRFIPFGVRNALFLTAGLGKMNFTKFALSDLLACTISSLSFFSLYYYYGETVIDYIKQGNIVIFGLVIILLSIFWYKNKRTA